MKLNWKVTGTAPDGSAVSAVTTRTQTGIMRQRSGTAERPEWSAAWYLRKMIHGRRELFPLGRAPAEAIRLADEITSFLSVQSNTLDDALAKYASRSISRPGLFSTIGDVLRVHRENVKLLELGDRTAKGYYNALIRVVRASEAWRGGQDLGGLEAKEEKAKEWGRVGDMSLAVLDDKLLLNYQRAAVADEEADEEELLTAKISANSIMRNARALFGEDALKLYREHNLRLPDLDGFMGVSYFRAEKFFELPSPSVVHNLFKLSAKLKKENPGAYRVFFAAIHCGLRRSEIAALSPAWIEDDGPDRAILKLRERGEFKPKHGHGRAIVLQGWVAAKLRELCAEPGSYLGTSQSVRDTALEDAVAWLRKNGIDASKPVHELRKLWTCAKVKTEGLLAAQQQAGHRDANTTSRFYADNKLSESLVHYWTAA